MSKYIDIDLTSKNSVQYNDDSFKFYFEYYQKNNIVTMNINKSCTFIDVLFNILNDNDIKYDIIHDDKINYSVSNKDTLILSISFNASNFLDLFGKLNDEFLKISDLNYNKNKNKIYELLKSMNEFYLTNRLRILPKITFSIFNKDLSYKTVIPFKEKGSDVGFDITLIREIKRDGNMIMYGSNISVEVPLGYYTELVPRSSIYKSGHIQANSVGILDPNLKSELYAVLYKIDLNKPDITLPFRYGQLILKKYELAITEIKD